MLNMMHVTLGRLGRRAMSVFLSPSRLYLALLYLFTILEERGFCYATGVGASVIKAIEHLVAHFEEIIHLVHLVNVEEVEARLEPERADTTVGTQDVRHFVLHHLGLELLRLLHEAAEVLLRRVNQFAVPDDLIAAHVLELGRPAVFANDE